MKKKTISLVLALLMVFSLLPLSALADSTIVDSGKCGKDLTWTLDNAGVLTITGTGEMNDDPWRWNFTDSIKSVIIADGVTSIYGSAFDGCKAITEVSIPDSVTEIGACAFEDCSGLTEITLPSGITSIESNLFAGCTGLTEITIPDGVTNIESCAFENCSSLKKIDIPDSVTSMDYAVFSGCSSLTNINIPSDVYVMGSHIFKDCTALTSVVLPNRIKYIQGYTFSGCSSLKSVRFADNIKVIYENAFAGCDALELVYFDGTPEQLSAIEVKPGNDVFESVPVFCAKDYPFSDIANSGYREWITLGYAIGIVNGYPDGTYRPNNPVTRAQYITMLYNMCGKPDVGTFKDISFKDANTIPAPFTDAVKWGVAIGIISGYGDNTFRPNKEISRAEMAAFSYRLMKDLAGGEPSDELKVDCGFYDSASIPDTFREAVNVCANLGIIQGFSDGTFRPNATANRGQAATILVRVAASLGS